jgi:transposase InsO family protein
MRLATTPAPVGSDTWTNMIGVVRVSFCNALVAGRSDRADGTRATGGTKGKRITSGQNAYSSNARPTRVPGRIYQQTFIDTYTKVSFAKLYDRKTPITAADLLNDRVLPFFEEHDVKLLRVLTDRGSEFCGNPERHEYELYLAVEDIDHSRTKTKSPQTNGICERFHKTALNEFYRVAFRKKVYRSIDELQADLDAWFREYNETRPHQGRWCFGKTPMRTFLDAMPMTKEKMIAA